jgi:hypothetical protein
MPASISETNWTPIRSIFDEESMVSSGSYAVSTAGLEYAALTREMISQATIHEKDVFLERVCHRFLECVCHRSTSAHSLDVRSLSSDLSSGACQGHLP